MGKLEYVSEVDEEVGVIGAVGVAEACVDGAEKGMVAVAGLYAVKNWFGEELVEMVGSGGNGSSKEDVVVAKYAVLCLELDGEQLVSNILHVPDTGKGHLLLDSVTEPFAAEGVAEGQRDIFAEKETRVKQGLQCEASGRGEVDAEMGADVIDTDMVVEADEVGGAVEVGGVETDAARGKVPMVLGVEVDAGVVGEVVLVGNDGGSAVVGKQVAVVVEIIPTEASMNKVVVQAQVKRCK